MAVILRYIFFRGGGRPLKEGTIISVPSSTGNGSNARDPEWHFGMKLHIGTNLQCLARHFGGRTRRFRAGFCTARRSGSGLTPDIAGS